MMSSICLKRLLLPLKKLMMDDYEVSQAGCSHTHLRLHAATLIHIYACAHSSSYSSSRSFSKSSPYVVKVGIPEFLSGIGSGVESHVAKLDSEIGDFQKLLVTRTLKLKKLGIPCKHLKESVLPIMEQRQNQRLRRSNSI